MAAYRVSLGVGGESQKDFLGSNPAFIPKSSYVSVVIPKLVLLTFRLLVIPTNQLTDQVFQEKLHYPIFSPFSNHCGFPA